jgi:hypothetical protein
VAKGWSNMMREQQINPIYPPREDVRIGDVFLSEVDPANYQNLDELKGFLPIPLLVLTTNADTTLKSYYSSRGQYPFTPTNGVTNINNEFWLTPPAVEATDATLYLPNKAPNRLRSVAFPEFNFTKIDQASLQAVIPVEALNVALGANYGRAKDGYLKISSGESVSLPAILVHQFIEDAMLKDKAHRIFKEDFSDFFNTVIAGNRSNCWLTVVTEVFFARSIDVSINSKSAYGGAIGVNAGKTATVVDLTSNAVQVARSLNALNKEYLTQSSPGGGVSFTSVSSDGIGLRRTYSRPIAIGFRGYTLQVVKTNDKFIIEKFLFNSPIPVQPPNNQSRRQE